MEIKRCGAKSYNYSPLDVSVKNGIDLCFPIQTVEIFKKTEQLNIIFKDSLHYKNKNIVFCF